MLHTTFIPCGMCKSDVNKLRMGSAVHKPHLHFYFMEVFQTLGFKRQTQESKVMAELHGLTLPQIMQKLWDSDGNVQHEAGLIVLYELC